MRLIATTDLIKITLVHNLDVINTPKPTWWANALSVSLLDNGDNMLWLKASEGEDTDVGHWVGNVRMMGRPEQSISAKNKSTSKTKMSSSSFEAHCLPEFVQVSV